MIIVNREFGKKLRALRLQAKITQKQLAEMLGVELATISAYETGKIMPSIPKIKKICEIFNINPDTILGSQSVDFIPLVNRIPVYDGARAGNVPNFPKDAVVLEWLDVPMNLGGKAGIIVHGDSMSPEINDGDIVIINPDLEIRSGDRVVVIFEDGNGSDGAVVKIFKQQNDIVILSSLNPKYPPFAITPEVEIKYCAKVVGVIKRYPLK